MDKLLEVAENVVRSRPKPLISLGVVVLVVEIAFILGLVVFIGLKMKGQEENELDSSVSQYIDNLLEENKDSGVAEPEYVQAPRGDIPGQIVLSFNIDASEEEIAGYISEIGGEIIEESEELNFVVVQVSEDTKIEDLPESPIVEEVDNDSYMAISAAYEPNDPLFSQQWALHKLELAAMWANLPPDPKEVTVAVIDTGACFDHPDLKGVFLDNGKNVVKKKGEPIDDQGHGCKVSGIIAANTNNELGIAGAAPNIKILPIKVFGKKGWGSSSKVAKGVIYATKQGVDIINLSLGGSKSSRFLSRAVEYAQDEGVIVIAAAGNEGHSLVTYPADYAGVISVGAIDVDYTRSYFSNCSERINTWAPGSNIMTTTMNGDYAMVSGTSFAAPYVSAITALEIAFDQVPDYEMKESSLEISEEERKALIELGCDSDLDLTEQVVNIEAKINQTPIVSSNPIEGKTKDGLYQYQLIASDPEGDALTYELLKYPEGMYIDLDTKTITWNVREGNHRVIVEISDGNSSAIQEFTIVASWEEVVR